MSFSLILRKEQAFLLPIMYAWTLLINYVLFYVFDLIDYIGNHNLDPFNNILILLSLWAVPVGITISFTGMFIDFYPKTLNKLVLISILGSSLSLLAVLYSLNEFLISLMIVSTILFGFFVGMLII